MDSKDSSTTASSSATESTTNGSTNVPSIPADASQLPEEALALATKIFDFARNGDNTSLSQYLGAGIPVNLTNHEGNTLLMLASYSGQPETVKLLLEHKADTNVLNGRGQSPLSGAVFKGYDEIVKLLVDAGADIRLGQPSGLDAARMFRNAKALEIMGVKE